mgnify:CR=1 FL=1
MSERLLTIDRLGHQGDGVATADGAEVFVPFALPGERVRARIEGGRGEVVEIVEASPDRVAPPCPHYTDCGGCTLQHLAAAPYAAFKRRLVEDAFAARGLEPEVGEAIVVPPGSRRRVVLAARRAGGRLLFGFHGRKSHRIVPITACPVAEPAIVAALPALARLAGIAAPKKGDLAVTVVATAAGLDVALGGLSAKDVDRDRLALVETAMAAGFARLAAAGEVVVERTPPMLAFGRAAVVPPPGGFLQAAAAGEAALAGLVTAAIGGAGSGDPGHKGSASRTATSVADLFAGAGTFTFRLAETARVHAVEGERSALAALDRAARHSGGLKTLTTERRDLFRDPLSPAELARFDAVVFDPPRAGAAAQAGALAASTVPVVVAVSCNPATLARDCRLLVDGGYRLGAVTPVDQFLWSAHVEAVAVLRR